jgi:hypothetical protein
MAEQEIERNEPQPGNPARLGCWILLVILALLLAVPIVYVGYHGVLRLAPGLFARRLPAGAQEQACALLNLDDEPRCQQARSYNYEFLPDLLGRYGPGKSLSQIEEELGAFQVSCSDDWIQRGDLGDYLDCHYAFDGDRDLTLYLMLRKEVGAPAESAAVERACTLNVRTGSLWDIYTCRPALNSGLFLVMADNTFVVARGFRVAFLVVDVLLLALLVWLARRANVGNPSASNS